jgi:S-adenosylmethionine hydrolase
MEYDLCRSLGFQPSEIIFNGPHKTKDELTRALGEGALVTIDHFGNLRTNIGRQDLGALEPAAVRIAATQVNGLVRTFGERAEGELIALFGSSGDLILAVVNGSAAVQLGARVGDAVEVLL